MSKGTSKTLAREDHHRSDVALPQIDVCHPELKQGRRFRLA